MIKNTIQLLTTRFNDQTWSENCNYREKCKMNGCIYGSATKIKETIPLNSIVIVVEMNNSKNKIEGISLIRNFNHFDKYYKIYQDGNYNRYIYKSEYRIDRINIDPIILHIFDYILFKEKTHLKRGIGLTTIPEKLLNHAICRGLNLKIELLHLFRCKFGEHEIIDNNCKENREII